MLENSIYKLLAAGAVLSLQSSIVFATISFDVGFTESTVGNAPLTEAAVANTTASKPTSLGLGAYVTATTVAGFPGGDTNNKVLLLTSNSTSKSSSTNARADLYFRAADSDAASSGKFRITMDIYIAALDTGALNNYFYVNLRDAAGTSFGGFGINYLTSAGYLNTGGAATNPAFSASVSKDSVHKLELLVDLDANTQTLTMDNNVTLGSSAIKDGLNLQQLTVNTDTTAQGKLYIDNVKISAVPEPSALGLLGAGAVASLACIRNKSIR